MIPIALLFLYIIPLYYRIQWSSDKKRTLKINLTIVGIFMVAFALFFLFGVSEANASIMYFFLFLIAIFVHWVVIIIGLIDIALKRRKAKGTQILQVENHSLDNKIGNNRNKIFYTAFKYLVLIIGSFYIFSNVSYIEPAMGEMLGGPLFAMVIAGVIPIAASYFVFRKILPIFIIFFVALLSSMAFSELQFNYFSSRSAQNPLYAPLKNELNDSLEYWKANHVYPFEAEVVEYNIDTIIINDLKMRGIVRLIYADTNYYYKFNVGYYGEKLNGLWKFKPLQMQTFDNNSTVETMKVDGRRTLAEGYFIGGTLLEAPHYWKNYAIRYGWTPE